MEPEIVFEIVIEGIAQPAGSKQAWVPTNKKTGEPFRGPGGRIVVNVVDDNPKSKDWKKHVATMARRAWGVKPLLSGPLSVNFTFYRERPQGHFGTGRNEELLKDAADLFPESKPDALKYARGVEDALSGVIYVDDAQIVDEFLHKRYGEPRVEIQIGKLPATVGEFRRLKEKGLFV